MARVTRRGLLIMSAGAAAPGEVLTAKPVVLGQVHLSFYAVVGAVIREVLERLGHAVTVREGPHEQIFPLLGEGSIDLMAAAWLPEGHAAYWAEYGRAAWEVARLYDGARFFLGMPDYVPETDVSGISDLANPPVAARTSRLIQDIDPGAAITTSAQQALAAYGLDRLGYRLRPGTPKEWRDVYRQAAAQQRWIVLPTWVPQYLNKGGRIRALKDPLGVLGGTNHASLVAPQERLAVLTERIRIVLARVSLGLDGVTTWILWSTPGRNHHRRPHGHGCAASSSVSRDGLQHDGALRPLT